MKCQKCKFENPDGMQFCGKCGSKLELICPQCHFSNPSDFFFCGKCGNNLHLTCEASIEEPAFEEKLQKIQRYLPQGLTEKILSQKEKIEGERKQVTVMFCDMVGFTELSEKIGPEDAYSIMDQVYEILIHKVHEFGGTVNEMTGDGVLALFGAPISIEDAPQRAIRVAMAIHREMTRLNDGLKKEQPDLPVLKMRVGIHTGPVVVGTLGNDLRVEFKAVGDTVNLASRMENLAEAGATYVSEDTFKITEGLFRFEALGEKAIKGKKDPVRVYRVISTSSRRTRFDVSAERGLTPFVGRERDLELLLDGFERARSGRGQAFSIMAEAGLGKSRLLYEFRKAVSNEDVTFLEGKCLSYSRGVAYHPVIDILKSNFNILDNDDCNKTREKVSQWLKMFCIDEASTLPYILELLSVKDSGIDQIDLSPEERKDRIMAAVNIITLKGAESRPLVIAVEDLHWIDRSSEEYFKFLLESISGACVFLIITYRPEYVHTWGGKSYHSQINLNRLSNRESLAMVAHLLGTGEIDTEIEELVLEKAEGVPFFIEEFIRSLKDLHVIEVSEKQYHLVKDIKDVVIPSTIQEVIMSRVDTLSEGARELLQIGAAIDREFSYELIQKVAALSERGLLSRLSVLKDSELIYERGIYPQSSYIFKHALTQEVVYDSVLGKRKRMLHQKIATAIEELYKDNIDDHYEVLAGHLIKAEDYAKANEYCRRICKKAEKTASLNYAIAFSKKRVECLERLPKTEDVQKKIVDARSMLGIYLMQMSFYKELKDVITPAIDLAQKYDYKRRLCQLYAIEGAYNIFIKENFPQALSDLQKAMDISKDMDDYLSFITAQSQLGILAGLCCDFEKASEYFQSILNTIQKKTESKRGIAIYKGLESFFVYHFLGNITREYQTSNEGLRLAEESGDIFSKAQAFTCHGASLYSMMRLLDAERYLLEGIKCCERINLPSWITIAKTLLGETYYALGNYEQSKNHLLSAVSLHEQTRSSPSMKHMNEIMAIRAMSVMGFNGKDVDFGYVYNYVSQNNLKIYEGWMPRLIGEIFLNMGKQYLYEAEAWIRKAIQADQRNGMMFYLAKDHTVFADYFRRKDDMRSAKENLNRAIQIFNAIGADGWAEKYEEKLMEMHI